MVLILNINLWRVVTRLFHHVNRKKFDGYKSFLLLYNMMNAGK